MLLFPGEVVVVVDFFLDACAQQRGHPLTDPVAPGVGVASGQQHTGEIVLAQRRVQVEQCRSFAAAASLAIGGVDEIRRQTVSQPA